MPNVCVGAHPPCIKGMEWREAVMHITWNGIGEIGRRV